VRSVDDLDLDGIMDLLASGDSAALGPGSVSQLDHALQTASILAKQAPDWPQLSVAGLVHDIGHLLGASDEAHAAAGARAIRTTLGEQVAAIVALHVEAKRYLVTIEPEYAVALASDSTASLVAQGGGLDVTATAAFQAQPLAEAAVALRRADDRAKSPGAGVEPLEHWVPLLQQLSPG